MAYFNYHAKAKQLIKQGQLVDFIFCDNYNNIKPAMVLFFYNHKPMPIRQLKWDEYLKLFESLGIDKK